LAGGTITESISLEGGDDVKSQLDGIGAAGGAEIAEGRRVAAAPRWLSRYAGRHLRCKVR
jgi:hypothetical protein